MHCADVALDGGYSAACTPSFLAAQWVGRAAKSAYSGLSGVPSAGLNRSTSTSFEELVL